MHAVVQSGDRLRLACSRGHQPLCRRRRLRDQRRRNRPARRSRTSRTRYARRVLREWKWEVGSEMIAYRDKLAAEWPTRSTRPASRCGTSGTSTAGGPIWRAAPRATSAVASCSAGPGRSLPPARPGGCCEPATFTDRRPPRGRPGRPANRVVARLPVPAGGRRRRLGTGGVLRVVHPPVRRAAGRHPDVVRNELRRRRHQVANGAAALHPGGGE